MNNTLHHCRTLIVEFNGLPGLGKTTVAEALIKELTDSGFKVVDGKYRSCRWQTLRSPLPELFNLKLYKLVASYARSIPPEYSHRSHLNWTNYYAWKYKDIVRHCNAEFAIVDEGIIQFFASIAHPDRMPETELVHKIANELKRIGIHFVRVDCINHTEEAIKRVLTRPSRGLSFERMDRDSLNQAMGNWAANLDYLRTVFSSVFGKHTAITIDTHNSVAENVNRIKEIIYKDFYKKGLTRK